MIHDMETFNNNSILHPFRKCLRMFLARGHVPKASTAFLQNLISNYVLNKGLFMAIRGICEAGTYYSETSALINPWNIPKLMAHWGLQRTLGPKFWGPKLLI